MHQFRATEKCYTQCIRRYRSSLLRNFRIFRYSICFIQGHFFFIKETCPLQNTLSRLNAKQWTERKNCGHCLIKLGTSLHDTWHRHWRTSKTEFTKPYNKPLATAGIKYWGKSNRIKQCIYTGKEQQNTKRYNVRPNERSCSLEWVVKFFFSRCSNTGIDPIQYGNCASLEMKPLRKDNFA